MMQSPVGECATASVHVLKSGQYPSTQCADTGDGGAGGGGCGGGGSGGSGGEGEVSSEGGSGGKGGGDGKKLMWHPYAGGSGHKSFGMPVQSHMASRMG
jgi:hypothetical protein